MSRMDKVQEEMRQRVSTIIQQRLQDPRIGFVTVVRVEVTADLRIAKVYFTALNEGDSLKGTIDGLNKSAGFVRRCIGESMRMKFTPEIRFIYDETKDGPNRIDEIIEKIHQEDKDYAD